MSNDIQSEASSLEALLDLNGEIYMMDAGYWVEIEAKLVSPSPSPSIPHGILYSLTLHDRNNARVVVVRQCPCNQAERPQKIFRAKSDLGS